LVLIKHIISLMKRGTILGNGDNMEKPTIKEIVKRLNMVLEGTLTREEVSTWAEIWTHSFMDADGLKESDLTIWKYLDVVSGIDLKDSPTEYLHIEEDINEWIKRFQREE